jgi:hypothetical protein
MDVDLLDRLPTIRKSMLISAILSPENMGFFGMLIAV